MVVLFLRYDIAQQQREGDDVISCAVSVLKVAHDVCDTAADAARVRV